MFSLQPPGNFDFTHVGTWTKWRQNFQRFRIASKLSNESVETQISTLIYCMGTEAELIYKSLTFKKKEDEKNFDLILSKFDAYFMPKKILYTSARNSTGERKRMEKQ